MNADLKRVRDSSLDALPSSSKRRAIGSGSSPTGPSHSSPPPDAGEEEDVEDWMRVVENHRKEAIFRQMLDYQRQTRREEARANALERQRRNIEACFRTVEACWKQVRCAIEARQMEMVCEGRYDTNRAQLISTVRDRAGDLEVPDETLLDCESRRASPGDALSLDRADRRRQHRSGT